MSPASLPVGGNIGVLVEQEQEPGEDPRRDREQQDSGRQGANMA